jgi:hypothetical protein
MIEAVKFGEVVDIRLTDDDPEKFYQIECKLVRHGGGTFTNDTVFARPFNLNTKQLPVKGEIVMLVLAPAPVISGNTTSNEYYYLTTVNIQGSINHNALFKSTFAQGLSKDEKLGEGFEEQSIANLQMYEGDVVHEGRFGQSIRLGSTVTKGGQTVKPTWEKSGNADNGAPITIIRNTHVKEKYGKYTVEKVDEDDSSVWMTSGQKVPLTEASPKYDSHESAPTKPKDFDKPQVIATADRILLNARTDGVLLFGKKTVSLSSDDSVNIDAKGKFRVFAKGNTTFDTPKIYLGKDGNEDEPVMLGETTNKWLQDCVKLIQAALDSISGAYDNHFHATGVGPSGPPMPFMMGTMSPKFPSFVSSKTQLDLKLTQKALLSKRNFTM